MQIPESSLKLKLSYSWKWDETEKILTRFRDRTMLFTKLNYFCGIRYFFRETRYIFMLHTILFARLL